LNNVTLLEGPASSPRPRKRYPRAKRAANPIKKRGLHTLEDLDRRTKAAQIAFRLVEAIEAGRGGAANVTAIKREAIKHCGLLNAFLEDIEARWLQGEPINFSDYNSALNTCRRYCETWACSAWRAMSRPASKPKRRP
jgi:tRNA isopentenyl-2-thiomethyl-A-37 hydroxylase MiaE